MMDALAIDRSIPQELADEMSRLNRAGFTLIPLGGDGKQPLCDFAERKPSLAQTLGLMRARNSWAYGIRLDSIMVIDADEMNGNIEDLIDGRFGTASVKTATPRGRHHFYRDPGFTPNLRNEGLPIDIKRGAHSYVVGPGSIRPDGGEYIGIHGRLGETPLLEPALQPKVIASVARGNRHEFLVKQARRYVEMVNSCAELVENLMFDRDEHCEAGGDPVPEAEVARIAEWAWNKRLEPGGLYEGRHSKVKVERAVLDHLLPRPGGAEAFALHSLLVAAHGHIPGKRFALDFDGMKDAQLIGFGRPRFRSARDRLLECGLLRKVGNYAPGGHSQHFQLGSLHLYADHGSPCAPITPGGEANSYICLQVPARLAASDTGGEA